MILGLKLKFTEPNPRAESNVDAEVYYFSPQLEFDFYREGECSTGDCVSPEFFLEAAVGNLRSYDDVDMNVFRLLILSQTLQYQLGSQLMWNQMVVNPDLHVVTHPESLAGA